MIRKIIAYSFLILANLILLAHAVIPHHHHEQHVCIAQEHRNDQSATCAHEPNEQNHQHDGSEKNSCALSQAVFIPSSQERFLKNCDNCTDTHNHNFYILSFLQNEELYPISETVTSVPDFLLILPSFVTATPGLRAPPVV